MAFRPSSQRKRIGRAQANRTERSPQPSSVAISLLRVCITLYGALLFSEARPHQGLDAARLQDHPLLFAELVAGQGLARFMQRHLAGVEVQRHGVGVAGDGLSQVGGGYEVADHEPHASSLLTTAICAARW